MVGIEALGSIADPDLRVERGLNASSGAEVEADLEHV
jgi:hypothetical protein